MSIQISDKEALAIVRAMAVTSKKWILDLKNLIFALKQ